MSEYEVKPMPYLFCQYCMLNGCYPWNKNPLLLCSHLGGLHVTVLVFEENMPLACSSYKRVTDEIWQRHLKDLKTEAKSNEKARIRAIDGKVLSNNPLPTNLKLKEV